MNNLSDNPSEWLTDKQRKAMELYAPPLLPDFVNLTVAQLFRSELLIVSWQAKNVVAVSSYALHMWKLDDQQGRECIFIHRLQCLSHSFSLCPFSLSFCISLAGRCYQCSYCESWKSRGLMRPSDNGHMLSPLWASCVLVVCVHWLELW